MENSEWVREWERYGNIESGIKFFFLCCFWCACPLAFLLHWLEIIELRVCPYRLNINIFCTRVCDAIGKSCGLVEEYAFVEALLQWANTNTASGVLLSWWVLRHMTLFFHLSRSVYRMVFGRSFDDQSQKYDCVFCYTTNAFDICSDEIHIERPNCKQQRFNNKAINLNLCWHLMLVGSRMTETEHGESS